MARESMFRQNAALERMRDVVRLMHDQANVVTFFVPGEPQGKARAQSAVVFKGDGSVARSAKTGRAVIRHYTPDKTVNYEANIRTFYQQAKRWPKTIQPVLLVLEIVHGIAVSWPAWKRQLVAQGRMLPVTKPDGDNVEKAVKDALNGMAWFDDTQVVGTIKIKRLGADPGVQVTIIPLAELPSTIKTRGAL